ncbi:MAG: hypothetical protein Q9157_001290 [Trypethelium eluteriae]
MSSHSVESHDIQTDVLIVGAGPAAASLACFLGYHGITGVMISSNSTTALQPRAHFTNSAAFGEPILLKYATQHGFQARFDYKFLEYNKDSTSGLITSTVEDQISKRTIRIVSRYLCGGDGAGSSVVRQTGLPFHDTTVPGALALNVWYEADLTDIYRLNPGLLHAIATPEIDGPPWGLVAINRIVRPYTEFLMIMIGTPGVSNKVSEVEIRNRLRDFLGNDSINIKIKGVSRWRINEAYAEKISDGNIFGLGDAIHRHPPGNGLGSNTSFQDSYNLAWKIAYVIQGRADPSLLESYNAERQPVGKRIVRIANDTLRNHNAFYQALGITLSTIEERLSALQELEQDSPAGAERRAKLKNAYQALEAETEGLGAEMNQKYVSSAVYLDDEMDTGPKWEETALGTRFHVVSTFPGSRLPHAWLGTKKLGEKLSTHDLAGHGEFTIFTGIGGKAAWEKAADDVMAVFKIKINVYSIGRGQDYQDTFYMWEDRREVDDNGAVLVRPDRSIAWRSKDSSHAGKLSDVTQRLLGFESR